MHKVYCLVSKDFSDNIGRWEESRFKRYTFIVRKGGEFSIRREFPVLY